MSDSFSFLEEDLSGIDAEKFMNDMLNGDFNDEKLDDDQIYDISTTAIPSETPKKLESTDEKATTNNLVDQNESGVSAASSGYQSLNSVETLEQVEYPPQNVLSLSPPADMYQEYGYYNQPNQMPSNANYYVNENQAYVQPPAQQNGFLPSPPETPVDSSKPSVLVEMLNRNSSPQNVQQPLQQQTQPPPQEYQYPQQLGYPYYYNYCYPPTSMMPRAQMNYHQYYQPPPYYQQQNVVCQPNAPIQRYPIYVQPRMALPQNQRPVLMQQPSYVPAYHNPQQQQQQQWGQGLSQVRQIAPGTMLQSSQTSDPEKFQTFVMPPTPSKMTIPVVVDREETRASRTVEPYKIPVVIKPVIRQQLTGEAALLDINRRKYQRWYNCVDYMKNYLSSTHELMPFIIQLLEQSETSNELIQWKERTKKFEHDRAFEFKNRDAIAKAYSTMCGKEIKYNSITSKLTRLCNLRFDGCPVFQKTKQRSTYEIFPTLIPSHNDLPALVQIVNGLPVESME